MDQIKVKAESKSPMLMHNSRLANPLDPYTKRLKELTSIRKKTDETWALIAEAEWEGGLYYDEEIGVYIPSNMIEASIFSAAKIQKLGRIAKGALRVPENKVKLEYVGPKKRSQMYKDPSFVHQTLVGVQTNKIVRTRPVFEKWKAEFTVMFNPENLDRASVIRMIKDAGTYTCIGDHRPRYGQFDVQIAK